MDLEAFTRSTFPDPSPDGSAAVLDEMGLNLKNWLALRGRPVVLFGWHPIEHNTMTFEHESIRRAFRYLGFETIWFPSSADPGPLLAKLPAPRIFLTGPCGEVGARLVPFATADDVVIVHNEGEDCKWNGARVLNYKRFEARRSFGIPAHYPSDLLPHEFSDQWVEQKEKDLVYFVGSAYDTNFATKHQELNRILSSSGFRYVCQESWNVRDVHAHYKKALWAPVPFPSVRLGHLWFLPSRFVKALSRGCIPLSTNPIARMLLGEGAHGCIFANTWEQVAEQMRFLLEHPALLLEKQVWGMRWAQAHSALHFLEYIWPSESGASDSYWETQSAFQQTCLALESSACLEMLLRRYPDNFIVLMSICFLAVSQGRTRRAMEVLSRTSQRWSSTESAVIEDFMKYLPDKAVDGINYPF